MRRGNKKKKKGGEEEEKKTRISVFVPNRSQSVIFFVWGEEGMCPIILLFSVMEETVPMQEQGQGQGQGQHLDRDALTRTKEEEEVYL